MWVLSVRYSWFASLRVFKKKKKKFSLPAPPKKNSASPPPKKKKREKKETASFCTAVRQILISKVCYYLTQFVLTVCTCSSLNPYPVKKCVLYHIDTGISTSNAPL